MTKLLDQAFAKVMTLPDEKQDALALAILTDLDGLIEPLDDETIAAIREGLEQAQRGEFVPEEEMAEFWKRHGVRRFASHVGLGLTLEQFSPTSTNEALRVRRTSNEPSRRLWTLLVITRILADCRANKIRAC